MCRQTVGTGTPRERAAPSNDMGASKQRKQVQPVHPTSAGVPLPPPPDDAEACARTVFFARVPPEVPVEEILTLFQGVGPVTGVSLFRPWATSTNSKGCGLVQYEQAQHAAAAIQQLDGIQHWSNACAPLLVEGMERHKLKARAGRSSADSKPPAAASKLAMAGGHGSLGAGLGLGSRMGWAGRSKELSSTMSTYSDRNSRSWSGTCQEFHPYNSRLSPLLGLYDGVPATHPPPPAHLQLLAVDANTNCCHASSSSSGSLMISNGWQPGLPGETLLGGSGQQQQQVLNQHRSTPQQQQQQQVVVVALGPPGPIAMAPLNRPLIGASPQPILMPAGALSSNTAAPGVAGNIACPPATPPITTAAAVAAEHPASLIQGPTAGCVPLGLSGVLVHLPSTMVAAHCQPLGPCSSITLTRQSLGGLLQQLQLEDPALVSYQQDAAGPPSGGQCSFGMGGGAQNQPRALPQQLQLQQQQVYVSPPDMLAPAHHHHQQQQQQQGVYVVPQGLGLPPALLAQPQQQQQQQLWMTAGGPPTICHHHHHHHQQQMVVAATTAGGVGMPAAGPVPHTTPDLRSMPARYASPGLSSPGSMPALLTGGAGMLIHMSKGALQASPQQQQQHQQQQGLLFAEFPPAAAAAAAAPSHQAWGAGGTWIPALDAVPPLSVLY